MPPSYITIPRSEYASLLGEMKQSLQVCDGAANLRIALVALERRLPGSLKDKATVLLLRHVVEACEEIAKFRIELLSFERHLNEFANHDLTPVRHITREDLTPVDPPGHNDSQAAFKAATEYAQGIKKPPPRGGE